MPDFPKIVWSLQNLKGETHRQCGNLYICSSLQGSDVRQTSSKNIQDVVKLPHSWSLFYKAVQTGILN